MKEVLFGSQQQEEEIDFPMIYGQDYVQGYHTRDNKRDLYVEMRGRDKGRKKEVKQQPRASQ